MKTKILWLSPNLNHYKAKFLNHLAKDNSIDITVLAGTGRANMGHQDLNKNWNFKKICVNVSKKDFGHSLLVKNNLKIIFNEFCWVMIPVEKKNLNLFLFALKLKKQNKSVKLFSYNHPILKSSKGQSTIIDQWLTKWFYKKLDRVIFYTEKSCEWALAKKIIIPTKAFWANNTVDNTEVNKYYNYQLPPENIISILFIGRLIPSKRIPDLMKYYSVLKQIIPDLKLDIIGDGPERPLVESYLNLDKDISWHGSLINEVDIEPIMKRASIVFIPGHSGLSINHSFTYGRPYVTLQGPSHAPELDYIDHGKNGYILNGSFETNTDTILNLLCNRNKLELFCNNAKEKGNYLSIQNWVKQMKQNLLNA